MAEAPFDSMRKMMSTVHATAEGVVQYTKGAPDEILKRCTRVRVGGKDVPLTDEKREETFRPTRAWPDRAAARACRGV